MVLGETVGVSAVAIGDNVVGDEVVGDVVVGDIVGDDDAVTSCRIRELHGHQKLLGKKAPPT